MRSASRPRVWLVVDGACLMLGALVILWLPASGSVLGTTVACGNGFGFLSGTYRHVDALTTSICQPAWYRSVAIGFLFGIGGVAALTIGLAWRKAEPPVTAPWGSPPPGWYPSPGEHGTLRWWTGHEWTTDQRPDRQ